MCGPGNNGGDGLVAARHLKLFGHSPSIYYPKATSNQLYNDLQNLAQKCQVAQIDALPNSPAEIVEQYDLIVDSIFGFSFQASGDIREPFGSAIELLKQVDVPVVAIDIPSGWHVEQGYQGRGFASPACLISLTAPKQCAAFFRGQAHYLGGRFMPEELLDKYGCRPPVAFPSSASFVRLP